MEKYISNEEFNLIMLETKKEHHKLAFWLAYTCGLRTGEVNRLKRGEVNLEEGYIKLDKRIIPLSENTFNFSLLPLKCGMRAMQIAFRGKCKKIGFNYSFKDLRSSFMINSIRDGKSVSYVNYICGIKNGFLRTPRSYRNLITKRTRIMVFNRDDFKCKMCGRGAEEVRLHVDHIIALTKGGDNSLENLQTLCEDCNQGKSNIKLNNKGNI